MCGRLSIFSIVLCLASVTQRGWGQDAADPVSVLARRVEAGTEKLSFDPKRGYLPALLKALQVPQSSQVLAFSKTSSQANDTTPHSPRAIYFSDTVSVAWVPGSKEIDVASVDSQKGSLFYTVEQSQSKAPKFTRRDDCLSCHQTRKTLDVPGWVVRSVYTASNGLPLANVDGFINGHNSPLEIRWGGWYVTGAPPGLQHLGNQFTPDAEHLGHGTHLSGSDMKALRQSLAAQGYLKDTSDLVALLVLEHQVRMQALLTLAKQETSELAPDLHSSNAAAREAAEGRLRNIGEMLVAYMLFRDEAPLPLALKARSKFAREFDCTGLHDGKGRSLKQLDLRHHLFRYPCSYLVYGPSFDALPAEMKSYIWSRLIAILQSKERPAGLDLFDSASRRAVLEILSDTKPEFHARLTVALDQ